MTRRELLYLASQATLLAEDDMTRRIARIIHDFEQQGFHRTATDVDNVSGDWLMKEVRAAGLNPSRETFTISRVDPIKNWLVIKNLSNQGDRHIEGVPLFDGGFTDAAGVTAKIGPLASDAPIGLVEIAPNTAGAGALGEARRQNRHKAIVAITRGGRPGLCPSNAESFLHPFGPPVLQVSSEESKAVNELARASATVTVITEVKRTNAEAFNVLATLNGVPGGFYPLIVMTPRSGWWTCASERGGGIACWLELMRALRKHRPAHDVVFVASSGHELGQLGIEFYAKPQLMSTNRGWIHFGANVGAAQDPGTIIQASDDEMEATMAKAMTAAGITITRRVPRGTVPGGEAGVVHRGGGRYMSVIGRNALFHNPADRGPDAIDPSAIARFAAAFTRIARTLAS